MSFLPSVKWKNKFFSYNLSLREMDNFKYNSRIIIKRFIIEWIKDRVNWFMRWAWTDGLVSYFVHENLIYLYDCKFKIDIYYIIYTQEYIYNIYGLLLIRICETFKAPMKNSNNRTPLIVTALTFVIFRWSRGTFSLSSYILEFAPTISGFANLGCIIFDDVFLLYFYSIK